MVHFEGLPTELLLEILEYVTPEDVEYVSMVSMKIRWKLTSLLENHRKSLRERYAGFRNVVMHGADSCDTPSGLVAELLCSILSDRRIGRHVKTLDLKPWSIEGRQAWYPDKVFEGFMYGSRPNILLKHPKTYMQIIEKAVRPEELIPKENADEWVSQIWRSSECQVVAAVLLLRIPKLHTLRLGPAEDFGSWHHSQYLVNKIQSVVTSPDPWRISIENVEIDFLDR